MAITYSIEGGADAAKFTINASTGALTFKVAPNFEAPGSAAGTNVYQVTVKATDAGGLSSTKPVTVTVTDVSEGSPPQITSAGAISVKENQTTVMTVTATDPDDATPPPSGGLPWTAPVPSIKNFNKADSQRWNGISGMEVANHNANKTHSLTNPDGQTVRFEVRSGDHWYWDAEHDPPQNERSEIQWINETAVDKDFRVNFEFMIEAGPAFTSWFLVLEQIQTPPGGTPPYYVGIENNKHMVRLATDASQQNYVYPFRDTVDIRRGHWYQMQVLVNFTAGVCDITRDGVQIVRYRGPFGNAQGGTGAWQIGIYRNAAPETMAVNYRNIVVTPGVSKKSS